MRESFIFHSRYLDDLPEEHIPTFAMYIINYALFDKEPEISGLEKTVWIGIKRDINKTMTSNIDDRHCKEYKLWRKAVFERDNYTCQICGATDKKLNAHHIKRFAKDFANRFNVENGMTLCAECHRKVHKTEGR